MYQQLTRGHSLYCLNEDTFNLFVTTATAHSIDGYISNAASVNSLNSHAIVLHIWCLLNEDQLNLIKDPNKMMPYSIDCYILKLLQSNKRITYFLKTRVQDQHDTFIFAYYLACATLKWGDQIILELKEGIELCEINHNRDYFKLHERENISQVANHDFYHFQKTIIKAMVADVMSTNRFEQFIDEAFQQTRDYFTTKKWHPKRALL